MRYLSVCSGIESVTVAWHPLGFEPVAFAEIEPFPSAVLKHHYPSVPNWGDLTKFKEWPDADIALLVGGTPCQSFSVAGLRAGLADPRGNLALTYLAILDRYRPTWCCWENVPGVLSADDGGALGAFLGGLGALGYGFAYRVLDAQYFGLAQRRARVFVVGHLGDWRRAAAVLFERESLSGHPAPRRETGEDVTGTLSSRASAGDGLGTDFDCAGGTVPVLRERERALTGSNQRNDAETETLIVHAPIVSGSVYCGDMSEGQSQENYLIAHSRRADGFNASEDGTGRGTPLIPTAVYPINEVDSDWNSNGVGVGSDGDPCPTLQSGKQHGIAFSAKDHGADAGELAPTLRAGGHAGSHANGGVMPGEKTGPLDTDGHTMGILTETLYNQGINHASTSKTYAGTLLRALRDEVGAEAFTQWGLGILDSLFPAEVLQSRLHGCGIRLVAFSRRWLVYHALARPEAHSEGLMLAMREAEREGRASQGWQPSEQLARELGAYLSELSQPGPQAARFMRDLWQAAEGLGLLREALSAVQEMGRSAGDQGQPIRAAADRAGSEPREGVLGSRMPEALSRERVLRDALAAGAEGHARQAADDAQRTREGAVGAYQVRRLTVEECEFLQGFPRGFTAIPYRGKPAADGPRYKALGNSMAVPCMRWIGRRIQLVENLLRELERTA